MFEGVARSSEGVARGVADLLPNPTDDSSLG